MAYFCKFPGCSISPPLVAEFTLHSAIARLIWQQAAAQIKMAEIPISMFTGEET